MRSYRVDAIGNYLAPDSAHWSRISPARVPLMPTPLDMQPTPYIRNSWAGRKYGETAALEAASVHDGATWAVRVSWTGNGARVGTDFPDAVAVALPVRNNPVLVLMGAPTAPIHYLRWSAKEKGARSLIATGIGSSAPGPDVKNTARAVAHGLEWHVVLSRAMGVGQNVAPLSAGARTAVGFAVWLGGNDERAGIKAFSIDWTEIDLDA